MDRSATLGRLFNTTKNGSEIFDNLLDHHNNIAIKVPNITPKENPINVSVKVTPKCFNKPLDDKFKKVFIIFEG